MTKIYDVVVIGGGIAGVTAAIYSRRSNLDVLLLEKGLIGGQILSTGAVENYPATPSMVGSEFGIKFMQQLNDLEVEIMYDEALEIIDGDIKTIKLVNGEVKAKAIILALGLASRRLSIPKEEELIGKGISYCGFCDAFFYKNKTAVVVGGGNSALEDALNLSQIAKKVYLVHRREDFNADAKTVKDLKKQKNVEFILNSEVVGLEGDDKLTGIKVRSKTDNSEQGIKTDGLFINIGKITQNVLVEDLVDMTKHNYIIVNENMETSVKGIYSAGDSNDKKIKQLTTAASDGTIAGINASIYVKGIKDEA